MLRLSAGASLSVALAQGGRAVAAPAAALFDSEELVTSLSPVIRLFPAAAEEARDGARLNVDVGLNSNLRTVYCSGDSQVVWNALVSEPGPHEIQLSYAAPEAGTEIQVQSGSASISEPLPVTAGVFPAQAQWRYYNFERLTLQSKLWLGRGVNPIVVRIKTGNANARVRIRCVELTAAAAVSRWAEDMDSAGGQRADTTWFVRAGYGVKYTWADDTRPRKGAPKPYAEAVDDFPVKAFGDLMETCGAGYVIFQVNRTRNHCPAPIASWEDAFPGHTTNRDLIGEIADDLGRRGVRLLLYMASPVLGQLGPLRSSGRYQLTLGEEALVDRFQIVLTEMGRRYGQRLAGYWLDGWTRLSEAYHDIPYETILRACRVGNAGRLTALNSWIFPIVSPWQDYWAGEVHSLPQPFSDRIIGQGAGAGLQAHALVSIHPHWNNSGLGPIPPPQFTAEELVDYVQANIAHQAVTSINVGAYQEGDMIDEHRQMLVRLRREVRGA